MSGTAHFKLTNEGRANLFLTLGGMQDRISPRLVSAWLVPSPRPSEF